MGLPIGFQLHFCLGVLTLKLRSRGFREKKEKYFPNILQYYMNNKKISILNFGFKP